MRKGMQAQLKLPEYCLDILSNNKEILKNHINEYSSNIYYEIYLGEFNNTEICGIDITIMGDTCKDINNDYKNLKKFLNEITGEKAEQLVLFKFDRY